VSDENHEFDSSKIGEWSDEVAFSAEREHMVAFAAATNDDLEPHAKGEYAAPVYAVVPAFMTMAATTMAVVPDELKMRILHGEQDIRIVRPIRAGDDLRCRAKVVGIHGRSSGVVVTTFIETSTAQGELVNEQYFTGFFRGGRLDGGKGETPPEHGLDPALRDSPAEASVVQGFDEDQTFRYAAASGDPMPIHTDQDFAKSVGLPGIIIHGLCTMAFVSRAVIETACPEDPSRLKRIAVRFSAPAQPKHTITTQLWKTGPDTYAFETSHDEGALVIKDGLAEIAS